MRIYFYAIFMGPGMGIVCPFFSVASSSRRTQYVLYHDAAFLGKYLHTTNPCKLLELCISERCFFFLSKNAFASVCVQRSHPTNRHISSGILITPEAFPQFYLLFLTIFFYCRGNHRYSIVVTGKILYGRSLPDNTHNENIKILDNISMLQKGYHSKLSFFWLFKFLRINHNLTFHP